MILICTPLSAKDVDQFLNFFPGHLPFFFEELIGFLIGLFVFFMFIFLSILHILDTNPSQCGISPLLWVALSPSCPLPLLYRGL